MKLKKISNSEVAEYLTNIATAYEIKGKGRFQIVAYQNAADTIISYPESIFEIWQKDPKLLDQIPHIGPSILLKIDYLFKTGKPYPKLKAVFTSIDPAVFTLTIINGIGPLIAYKLTEHFKFSSNPVEDLIKYCQDKKIETIPTFGQKSQESMLANALSFLGRQPRLPLMEAQTLADKIIKYLKLRFPDIEFYPLGSLRRESPTVGDIDIAAKSTKSKEIVEYFLQYPGSVQTLAKGKNKASFKLLHDIRIDLMIKPATSFGSLLQHFTGSRQHNILLRQYALKLGYSLSEYGIKDLKTNRLHRFCTEEKFYDFLHLTLIPPIERVGENELEKYRQ